MGIISFAANERQLVRVKGTLKNTVFAYGTPKKLMTWSLLIGENIYFFKLLLNVNRP